MANNAKIGLIGLGITGSAIAAHLAKQGYQVSAFEQFTAAHNKGSSHGENRLFRHIPAEGERYVEMACKALELWPQIEQQSGRKLFEKNGCLDIGGQYDDWAERSFVLSQKFELPAERLTQTKASQMLPLFKFETGMGITYSPYSGVIKAEESVLAFQEIAAKNGAAMHFDTRVKEIDIEGKAIQIEGQEAQYFDHIIIAAGSWLKTLVEDAPVSVEKSVLGWFKAAGGAGGLPGFSFRDGETGYYGMPSLDGSAMKIGHGRQYREIQPSLVSPEVMPSDKTILCMGVQRHFMDLDLKDPRYAGCKITHAPHSDFIFQHHKDNADVFVISPCSGHGFKYAPVYGGMVERMIKGDEAF